MNYFKGNGSCGISASPEYTKNKDGGTKLPLTQNAVIKNDSVKRAINQSVKYINNIFTD